jgi:hypothetical protein
MFNPRQTTFLVEQKISQRMLGMGNGAEAESVPRKTAQELLHNARA